MALAQRGNKDDMKKPEVETGQELPRPLVGRSIYARCVFRVTEVVGGIDAACRALQAPRRELLGWITGAKIPPMAVFLDAVDIVLKSGAPMVVATEEAVQPAAPQASPLPALLIDPSKRGSILKR